MERDEKGRFVKGNKVASKEGRLCGCYPFCKNRINKKDRINKKFCSPSCKANASKYNERNNLKVMSKKELAEESRILKEHICKLEKKTKEGYNYQRKAKMVKTEEGELSISRHIMETMIKRKLSPIEVVHHINGNESDNCSENLYLFENNRLHSKFHRWFRKSNKTD